MRRLPLFLALAVAAALAVAPPAARAASVALGPDGTLARVTAGRYADLFAGRAAAAENPVLAVDLTSPSAGVARHLVPRTEGPEVERLAAVLIDDASGRVLVVWEEILNVFYSRLLFTSFDGTRWAEPIDVSGSPFSTKNALQVELTRDEIGTGTDSRVARTLIHLLWWENAGNEERAIYAPVVLLDGEYLDWNATLDLHDTLGLAPRTPGALGKLPRLQRGIAPNRFVIGLVSDDRLLTLELRLHPSALLDLADRVEAAILASFADPTESTTPGFVAEKARAHIIKLGVAFHPSVTSYLSEAVASALVAAAGPGHAADLAADARAHIIKIGVTILGNQLRALDPDTLRVREVRSPAPGLPDPTLLFDVRTVTDRALPELPADREPRLAMSSNGRHAAIGWMTGATLHYYLDADAGWTERRSLATGPDLSVDQAFAMILDSALSQD